MADLQLKAVFLAGERLSFLLDYIDELRLCRRENIIQLNICVLSFYIEEAHNHRIIIFGPLDGADKDIRGGDGEKALFLREGDAAG
jgi:hypothetical protein